MTAILHQRLLPAWLEAKLATPPVAGGGIHSWLFSCACGLLPWRASDQILQILVDAAVRCSRPVPHREIVDAVNNARNNWRPESGGTRVIQSLQKLPEPARVKPWPKTDWCAVEAISKSGHTIADLSAASPGSICQTSREVVGMLWYDDPLLCLAKSHPADAITLRRSEWLKHSIDRFGLIVPSAMMARKGKRQDGKPSKRCLDNTGPRSFLVVEFDFKASPRRADTPASSILADMAAESTPRTAPDLCAAILLHMLELRAPLVLAVHSGGKSIHGWFPTHGANDEALRPFFRRCVSLGADPATWIRWQLVRLPGGTRSDGTRQRILYINPARIHVE